MTNSIGRSKIQRGFTLIELLVVIAIIGIIAAILLPVFATVRERGRSATCQNNLRQIALAMAQYVQDNDGRYPVRFTTPEETWQSRVYPYLKSTQVFQCPDEPADHPYQIGAFAGDYDFNIRWLNTFVPPYPAKTVLGTNEALLATPSTIYLNVDAGWISMGVYHYLRTVPKTACGRSFDGSTLHSGGGNYSFVDSHVKWQTPEQAGDLECQNGPLPAPFKD